jgi:glycosyltransferase involved in cell wall biosynthesis
MRIALVSDAWHPQRNGVVRVLASVLTGLEAGGHQVLAIEPGRFRTVSCPTYPEIRLSLLPSAGVRRLLSDFRPQAVHIATEGPLGWAARRWCLRHGHPFTTAYHTKFPEYLHARFRLPLSWSYALMRRFHGASAAVMCPSGSVQKELTARGFANAVAWTHGVDAALFRPRGKDYLDLPRPVFGYVGRVAAEKNLPAFLSLDLPGSKLVVGDGPARRDLMDRYPDVHWRIAEDDDQLSRYYSALDCFVFPSLTDTFGLVMLEALASGVPVAAFPVPGPMDVVGESGAGILSKDLGAAAVAALGIDPGYCRKYAESFAWERVVFTLQSQLRQIDSFP